MKQIHDYPYNVYYKDYFKRWNNSAAQYNFLRIQDEFATLCYALDIVNNYLDVEKLLGIPYQSLNFTLCPKNQLQKWLNINKIEYRELKSPWIPLSNTVYRKNWTNIELLNLIKNKIKYKPKGVIDLGAGEGNVSSCLSHLKIPVAYIDPFGLEYNKLLNQENIKEYKFFNEVEDTLHKYDTIILTSTIEHLPKDYIFEILQLCKGMRFVIVNTITHHPIQLSKDEKEHCTVIDNKFYNELIKTLNIEKVIYRQESHLVGII